MPATRKVTKRKPAAKSEAPPLSKEKTSAPQSPADPKAENFPDSPETISSDKLDTDFEKKIGVTAKSLKALLIAEKPKENIKKLKELLRDNVTDARALSLRDWRVHAAVDEAYRVSFRQISPTLIGKIMAGDRALTTKEIEDELVRWGLPEDSAFTLIRDNSGKVVNKILNRETFTTVKVPIVKSMTNAREARLFSERDIEPFMSFEMNRSSAEWQVIGEIITKIVNQMSNSLGWKATYRALNHASLKYSRAFLLPREVWYAEMDLDEKGEEYTAKEGIRYYIPASSRLGWDQTHPPSTFNTDTGCEWIAAWRVKKFSEVDRNPAYYNKDKITYSTDAWFTNYDAYFREVYPCVAQVLPRLVDRSSAAKADRELEATFYTRSDHDKAIFETDLFRKLSPKEWGLSDYKPKVWFRFVVASDGCPIYAEPLPYCPALYLGTDADDDASSSVPSFSLEAVTWQDLVGNLLSQILLAMRQNAIKVILYDKHQITEQQIQEMMARAKDSVSAQWFPMDWKDLMRGQVDVNMLFKPFTFPQQNVVEMINALTTVFNVMERALGISAQEVGAIAGHIQTKAEVEITSGNVTTRVGLNTSMADDLFDGWKRQIIRGIKAYMDEEFVVEVSAVPKEIVDRMNKEFGFDFDDAGKDKMRVSGKKSKLAIDAFLSSREGRTRQNNHQVAMVMFQSISQIAGTDLAQRIGPERMLKMWNRALQMAGIPEDEKWQIDPKASSEAEQKRVFEAMQKFAKEITDKASMVATQQALKAVGKEIAPAIQKADQTADAAGQAAMQADQHAQAAGKGVVVTQDALKQLGALVMKIETFLKMATAQSMAQATTPAAPMEPATPPQIS